MLRSISSRMNVLRRLASSHLTARNTAIALGAQLTTFALSMAWSILIARTLGPEGKGSVAVLTRTAGVCQAFAQWGIQETVLPLLRSKVYPDKALVSSALQLGSFLSIISVIGLILSYPLLHDNMFRGISRYQVYAIGLSVLFTVLSLFLSRFVQLNSVLSYGLGNVIVSTLSLLCYVLSFLLMGDQLWAAIVAYIFSQVLRFIVFLIISVRDATIGWYWRPPIIREFLKNGTLMQVGLVGSYLGGNIAVLVLNGCSSSSDVGLFSTAVGLSRLLFFFSIASRLVLQSNMVSCRSESNPSSLTTQTVRHTSIWLIIGAIGIFAFGKPFLSSFYGKEFLGCYSMTLLLLPGMIMQGIVQIVCSYFMAVERLIFAVVISLISVSSNSFGLWLLSDQLTGMKASLIQTSAYFLVFSISVIIFLRISNVKAIELIPGRTEIRYYGRLLRELKKTYRERLTSAS